MYSKFHSCTHFLIALALGAAGVFAAQAQAPATPATPPATTTVTAAQATPVTTASFRGHVADPTGAVIPGATITIATPAGATVSTVTADDTGHYTVNGLAPGSYLVRASVAGFAPFASPVIQLAAGQVKRVDISMAMEVAEQSVVVTDESPSVNVEAGGNASAIVLKGKDLDALSDDPDELSNELTALAGPAAGPNGGQIYIDGFTGGTLPPKSAIREIRINQNPFSAEFDHIGYGRIEILTKPGTDVLHGRAFGMGNDSLFNTGNPFLTPVPAYHSIQYNGTISGAINKKASFFLSVEGRNIQDENIYIASTAVQNSSGVYYIPTDSNGNIIPQTGSVYAPSTRIEVAPRIDLQLGQKNTLTLRYQYEYSSSSGSLGATSLPTQATSGTSSENSLQLMDSQIINDHIVNETRLQYRRTITTTTPVSTTPMVSVAGDFSGGGNSGQFDTNHTDHLELQNITTMSAGSHAIKFGTWMRDNRDADSSNSDFNGSFSFPSLQAYADTMNGLAGNYSFATIASPASCPATQTGGCLPSNLTYTTGREGFTANVFDAALFLQDDWKYNRFLTLSGGLRWETQNHTADHSDWGPRVGFAYALDGHKDKKQARTVLRGGYGFFFDRFQATSLMSLEQYNIGLNSQKQVSITNPACPSATAPNTQTLSNIISNLIGNPAYCGTGGSLAQVTYQIDPSYRAPTMEQFGTSLERQVNKSTTVTLTYLHSYGVHQMVTRDSNAYLPGQYDFADPANSGSRPNPNLGIVKEFDPEAIFKQNQVIVNVNAHFTPKFSLMGFYNMNYVNSDTGTASNSYNLMQDYGRASWASRNMIFLMGNYTGPWGITFNPFLIAQSGRPYNITTNNDLTGDSFFNNRPSYASASSIPSDVVETNLGNFDTVPQTGEAIIPANLANGPAAIAVNLRVSRSIGLGPKIANQAASGPPPGGGPGGGGRGGSFGPGPFGGGGRGGPGGMGGPANTGHKYNLTFSVQALNLFNDINYGTPSGNLIPTLDSTTGLYGPGSRFGKSTNLAHGIFSSPTSSASRRIFFQAAFTF